MDAPMPLMIPESSPQPQMAVVGQGNEDVRIFLSATTMSPKIDAESYTISDVIMAQVGEARGHDLHIELQFLEDAATYASKQLTGRVQCNMGHNWDNLFRQLGAFSNLRVQGNKLLGDLRCYKSADKSPRNPGMLSWFMSILQEDKRSVMCSLSVIPKGYYQYDEKGNKVYMRYWWDKIHEDKKVFMEFGSLRSCDIVDDGALTDRLFSSQSQPQHMNQQITSPSPLEQFISFCAGLVGFKQSVPMSTETTKPAAESSAASEETTTTALSSQTGTQPAVATPSLEDRLTALEQKYQSELGAKDKQIQELQAKVTELGKQPAAEHTGGKTTDDVDLGEKRKAKFLASSINQRAQAILDRKTTPL